ncbi:DUF202 domain-containing protein [Hyphomonas oceanitis]|uniref:YidH family protein n=1 Tax=Hyphomonas oceanitis TaxID=81033 RepID=UPI0030030189
MNLAQRRGTILAHTSLGGRATDMKDAAEDHSRQDLAEDRTDWAEDRTLLANERTFASWMRTGLASAALGLGFNAVFKAVDPTWLAKAVATAFILAALAIYVLAYRNARRVETRMNCHSVEPVGAGSLLWVAAILGLATGALGIVLWII